MSGKRENIPAEPEEVLKIIAEEIFDSIYGEKKYRYNDHYHFDFYKIIDDYCLATSKSKLGVRIITPYFTMGREMTELDLTMMSARESSLIIKLPREMAALQEIEAILQFRAVPPDIGGAGAGKLEEHRDRLRSLLAASLGAGEFYVNSQRIDPQTGSPVERINSGLKLLVESLYHKLNYITVVTGRSELEKLILQQESQLTLVNDGEEPNRPALSEVREYLEESARRNIPVTMKNILDIYSRPPYGWLPDDIRGLVLRLFKNGQIKLQFEGAQIKSADPNLLQYLVKKSCLERLLIKKREKTPETLLNNAWQLTKAAFNVAALPEDEDSLMEYIKALAKNELGKAERLLNNYKENDYPGKSVLEQGKALLEKVLQGGTEREFYERFAELGDELAAFAGELKKVIHFFEKQRGYYDRALHHLDIYNRNKTYVLDGEIIQLVNEIEDIVQAAEPYGQISRLPDLLDAFRKKFVKLLDEEMEPVRGVIEIDRQKAMDELDLHPFRAGLAPKFNEEFKQLLNKLDACNNFYDALAMKEESDRLKLRCFEEIEKRKLERTQDASKTAQPGLTGQGKQVVNISIANIFHGAMTIETEDDLEQLLDYLRQQLKKELKENTRLKLI